jgi:PAS domain S-box-containing protein
MTIASAPQPQNRAPADGALKELAVWVAEGQDPAELLDSALQYVIDRLHADGAAVLAVESDGALGRRAARGSLVERALADHAEWASLAASSVPVLVADVARERSRNGFTQTMADTGVGGLALIPLALGSKVLGQLLICHARPHAVSDSELQGARAVGALLALALDQLGGRDREQRFRQLIEHLGVALYTTDANGVITFYNEEATVLWGRRPQVGVDRWCGSPKLFFPDGSPMAHAECPMAVALRERKPVRGRESVAERPDGTRVTFMAYPSPVLDRAGNLIGGVNVLVDTTRRRHAEAALKRKEETLVAALAEQEQTNAALQRVAMDLSVANAAKDEFLSLVSHELKTPLTTIWGNATILFRTNGEVDPESAHAALADIVSESERLHRIIENLLLLARVENGQAPAGEPLIVKRLVEQVVERHRQRRAGRVFEIHEQGDPRPVVFSEASLEQVVENLISNAEKYSAASEPIVIEFERTSDEVRLRVLDRGTGVPPEDMGRIFDSFFRSGSVKARSEGLGIGLAVCKRLVEAHGGRIWATSRPGGGSEFGFALPIVEDTDTSPEQFL